MIVELLLDMAIGVVGRSIARAFAGREKTPADRPSPGTRTVSPRAMEKRRAAYEAWATAHGLARTTMRGAELAGMVRGRATEMVTGLANERVPTSPEILIRIALPGVEASTLLEPGQPPQPISSVQAMATLLELDGIRNIGVTHGFVRLRFEPFVETTAFDDALAAFEHALAGDEASPYR